VTTDLARLVVPSLRWDRAHGFQYLEGLIDDALELGVGGFLIESGPRDDVAALIARLHADSKHNLLIAARAECGAGQFIDGFTQLPPLGALGAVSVVNDDGAVSLNPEPVRRAARLTARELRGIGVNWVLAPVCEAEIPGDRLGVRAASDDPAVVAAVVGEWIDAAQAESIVCTAKRFPGADDRPFVAAVDAGVSAVMISNVRAPRLIESTLRAKLGFEGLVVTPPVVDDQEVASADEMNVCVEAVAAGCDVVLAPGNLSGTVAALKTAAQRKVLNNARVRTALDRVDRWSGWAQPNAAHAGYAASLDEVMWSRQVADAAVQYLRGSKPRIGASMEIISLDTICDFLVATLRGAHIAVKESLEPSASERGPLVVVCASESEFERAAQLTAAAGAAGRDVAIAALTHPRLAATFPGRSPVLCAWDRSRPMQEAVARALVSIRQ
jgi:beta-glucosidase-like glycosyl hydrolase